MNTYKIIGLMSGTSLDGLDLAYCHFQKENDRWRFHIEQAESISYDTARFEKLKNAVKLSAVELLKLHSEYGMWLGEETLRFIKKYNLKADAVASHGHTVHHQPENGFTLQIGSGQHLSNVTQLPVVCDFRSGDVALDGQGAPLVPIGDRFLFGNYDFCLNLGGISNISFEKNGKRIAYDIGIANMLLNYCCQKIGKKYDADGNIARSGKIDIHLLEKLDNLPYYKANYPKSTGYEWFSSSIIPIIEASDTKIEDLLCTSVHHIFNQIKINILQNIKLQDKQKLLITGGGALNTFLIEVLQNKMKNTSVEIVVPEKQIIEFKEALIFAFMGVLRLRNEVNVLSSVTGALRDSCGGVLYLPQ